MNALHFDGTFTINLGKDNTHVQLHACDDMTYEMWFRPTSSAAAGWLIMKNAANGIKFEGINTRIRTYSGIYCNKAFASWQVGTWYHIAFVNKANCNTHLYVNGAEDGSVCNGQDYRHAYNLDMMIGGGYSPLLTNADLAEVRLWGVARSAAEINAHMRTALVVGDYPQNSLRGYWRFENSTDLEHDSSLWGGGYTLPAAYPAGPEASDWVGPVPWPQ